MKINSFVGLTFTRQAPAPNDRQHCSFTTSVLTSNCMTKAAMARVAVNYTDYE
jgi:hypothetical protein